MKKKFRRSNLSCAYASTVVVSLLLASTVSAMCPVGVEESKDISFPLSNDADWREISGVAVSRQNPKIVYVVNDGSANTLAAVHIYTGEHLATYAMQDVSPKDIEELTLGPCSPHNKKDCIYVADIGDNLAKWENGQDGRLNGYYVYKFEEPALLRQEATIPVYPDVLSFKYKSKTGEVDESPVPYNDSEAMFIEHSTSDLYFLTKHRKDTSNVRLYEFPYADQGQEHFPLSVVASSPFLKSKTWSRAAYDPVNKLVAIGTDLELFFFDLSDGKTIEKVLAGNPCKFVADRQIFGTPNLETVDFASDGNKIVEISECDEEVRKDGNAEKTVFVCPIPIWVSTLEFQKKGFLPIDRNDRRR